MCSSVAPAAVDAAAQRRLDQVDVVEPGGAVQIDDQMHAGAAHALADGEMVVTIVSSTGLTTLTLATFVSFFRAVLGTSKPLSDRKRAFWRIAVLPNQ